MTFVIICLDGFRYDYLAKTKFLKKLASENTSGQLYHGFGYASEFSAITGKNVEQLGIIANNFIYTEKGMKFFKFFSFLDSLKSERIRLMLNVIYNSKEFLIGNKQPKSIFQVPLSISNKFEFLLKKNFFLPNSLKSETIFDIFREKKLEVSAYMWPFIYENNKTRLDLRNLGQSTADTDDRAFQKSIQLLEKRPDVCYIHFFSTDNLVHRLGVNSKETLNLIKKLDHFVENISRYADKLLIFSDHGMTDVKETINIKKDIGSLNFKLGKDYLMFLDSTLARFWFYNREAESKITQLLSKSKKGKIVNFKNPEIHNKFGKLIFQLNPGIIILPNFYQSKPDKSTHGYSDSFKDERGMYINCNGKKKRTDLKMSELFKLMT